MVDIDVVRPTIEKIEQEVRAVSDQLNAEHKRIEQIEATLNQMKPIEDLDIDVSLLRDPRYLFSVLGTMPNDNIDRPANQHRPGAACIYHPATG